MGSHPVYTIQIPDENDDEVLAKCPNCSKPLTVSTIASHVVACHLVLVPALNSIGQIVTASKEGRAHRQGQANNWPLSRRSSEDI